MLRRFFKSSYSKSFVAAAGLHTALLFGGRWALSQKAKFGMEVGHSNIEVDLVAALPETQSSAISMPVKMETLVEPMITPSEPSEFVLPEKIEQELKPVAEENPARVMTKKPKLILKNQKPSPDEGDTSSPKPGCDSTTIQSSGGAVAEVKPDYLKNPPPSYP